MHKVWTLSVKYRGQNTRIGILFGQKCILIQWETETECQKGGQWKEVQGKYISYTSYYVPDPQFQKFESSVPVPTLSILTLYRSDNLQVINQWTSCWKLLNTALSTMGCHTMKCLFSNFLLVNKNILCVWLDKIYFGASLRWLARKIKFAVR